MHPPLPQNKSLKGPPRLGLRLKVLGKQEMLVKIQIGVET